MRESVIEAYLVQRVKQANGEAYKFKSPNRANVPDRLCLFPGPLMVFVECKAPGEKPTDAQEREHVRLRAMGFKVVVIDSKEVIDKWLAV